MPSFKPKTVKIPSKSEMYPYNILKFNYKEGQIVKLIQTDNIGEIIKQTFIITLNVTPIPVYILDIDPPNTKHEESELTIPTPEELELYKMTKKYNL